MLLPAIAAVIGVRMTPLIVFVVVPIALAVAVPVVIAAGCAGVVEVAIVIAAPLRRGTLIRTTRWLLMHRDNRIGARRRREWGGEQRANRRDSE